MFQENFKVVLGMFQGCFTKVSGRSKLQGCFMIFKGIHRVFQRCFKEVSRKLSRCYKKIHVAWHSSQLPEQKEGLLESATQYFKRKMKFFNQGFRVKMLKKKLKLLFSKFLPTIENIFSS